MFWGKYACLDLDIMYGNYKSHKMSLRTTVKSEYLTE